jgi:hypothetical protein
MNPQSRQVGRRFLCVLVAALVSLLLVVLPFAQTLDASDSGRKTGGAVLQDSGAPDFEYEDADIIVTANLSGNTKIPADAEFCVEPITQEKDSAAYKDVATQVDKDVTADHQTVTDFRAYDIYFSGYGTRYEPEAGDATVTIQYKDRIFDSAVKKATDEIKVLHLKKSGGKTKVENVTKAVDVKDLGGSNAKKTNSSSEAIIKDNGKDGSENIDGDTVEFVTKSFSTFVVTGIGTSKTATITTSLTFENVDGTANTTVSGTYYLYIECANYNGSGSTYRNTLTLTVPKGTGTVSVPLTGLYNQNGQDKNNTTNGTLLYPLLDTASSKSIYKARLFQYNNPNQAPPAFDSTFSWQSYTIQNGYFVYEQNSNIANDFTITTYPQTVTVNGSGSLGIVATAKAGTPYSLSDIMSALSPTLPFGVFADYFNLVVHMEGCIAVNTATIHADFGNTDANYSTYANSSNATITVKKTYTGSTQKTFWFGLFYNDKPVADSSGNAIKKYLTLDGNTTAGTVSFQLSSSNCSGYTVNELSSDGTIIDQNNPIDAKDGFMLTGATHSSDPSGPSSLNGASYIKDFKDITGFTGISGSHQLNSTIPPKPQNSLVFGNATGKGMMDPTCAPQIRLLWEATRQGTNQYSSNGQLGCSGSQSITIGNIPIDISGTLNNMATLSANLAKAVSTDTVSVVDIDAANTLDYATLDIPADPNKMLLLNIDATGYSVSNPLKIPNSVNWIVGGKSLTCDKNWIPQATNVVINVYKKSGSVCSAFDGEIDNAGYLKGTLLAPCATIGPTSSDYNGRIIAKSAQNDGGEIHSTASGSTGGGVTYQFTNKEYTSTPFTLPETGGGGMAIFYTTGGTVLLFGAILAYAYRLSGKRRHIRKRRHKSLNE